MPQATALIVTADDFGLTGDNNGGIAEAFRRGILRSTALLMNGTATAGALSLAKELSGLEVGIHLSLVEGYSLRAKSGTLTDAERYFPGGICLHRAWPQFVQRYLTGRIDLDELEEELDLQVQRFREELGDVPFANCTQHLHLLPQVFERVGRVLKRHGIQRVRLAPRCLKSPGRSRRALKSWVLSQLGRQDLKRASAFGLGGVDAIAGFDVAGQLTAPVLQELLSHLPEGVTELMTHPGFDSPWLRTQLPSSYGAFNWRGELEALTDPEVSRLVKSRNISLIQFKDLASLNQVTPSV